MISLFSFKSEKMSVLAMESPVPALRPVLTTAALFTMESVILPRICPEGLNIVAKAAISMLSVAAIDCATRLHEGRP